MERKTSTKWNKKAKRRNWIPATRSNVHLNAYLHSDQYTAYIQVQEKYHFRKVDCIIKSKYYLVSMGMPFTYGTAS